MIGSALRSLTPANGLRRLLKRHPSLLRRRQSEPLPVTLDRRRIYILPTGFGLVFAAILLVMLIGALNYNNNAALLLTTLLGATTAQSMYGAFRNLKGLRLLSIRAHPVEAGQHIVLGLHLQGSGRARIGLSVRSVPGPAQNFSILPETHDDIDYALPTERRGWLDIPALNIETRWPFGLFRAWSWIHPVAPVLVYPCAERAGPDPDPITNDADNAPKPLDEDDDFAGLRDYRPGDPPRRIAWKSSAKRERPVVRLLLSRDEKQPWRLDWHAIHGLDTEMRIMRLTRWVREADVAGRQWELRLPEQTLGLDQGPAHLHACLQALALLP